MGHRHVAWNLFLYYTALHYRLEINYIELLQRFKLIRLVNIFYLLITLLSVHHVWALEDWVLDVGKREAVVIGDIHGDLNALSTILINERLIDKEGNWIGGDKVLVLLGDLIDRSPDSLGVMDLLMKLEIQARESGGHVESLLGNHELMVSSGDIRYISEVEHLTYQARTGRTRNAWKAIFQEDSEYAQWIRSRKTILKLKFDDGNNYVLVHAGLGKWALDWHPNEINKMVQKWFAYWQGVGPRPHKNTAWVIEDDGPLWNSDFADVVKTELKLKKQELIKILDNWQASFVVVGHTMTYLRNERDNVISRTKEYGRMLIMADTAISEFYKGRLSSIRIQGKKKRVRYHDRPKQRTRLTNEFRANCFFNIVNII